MAVKVSRSGSPLPKLVPKQAKPPKPGISSFGKLPFRPTSTREDDMAETVAVEVQGGATIQYIQPSTNNLQVVTILSPILDTHGGWNSVNKKYVIPVAGKYFVTGSVQFADGTPGYTCRVDILKNGQTVCLSSSHMYIGNSVPICTGVLSLAAGDYLQLAAYHDGPSPVAIQWAGCQLVAFWLGA